jgi:hypothetical protein
MTLTIEKLRKLAEMYDKFKNSEQVDIGTLNVLIREVTADLLEWQNISRGAAEALVEAAYQAGR